MFDYGKGLLPKNWSWAVSSYRIDRLTFPTGKIMPNMTEKIRGEFRKYLAHDHNLLILAGIIGCLAGFASTVFRWMIGFFDAVFSADGLAMLYIPEALYPYLLPLAPIP